MVEGVELPNRTDTLIIGAGIVGCSAARFLTEFGREDVTVVDQGTIPKTGGSTVHAPSGLMQTTMGRTMSKLAQETREIYSETGGYLENGNIEIATTEKRLNFLDHRMDQAKAWGVDGTSRLEPEEVQEFVPHIDPDEILGGFHVPTDGHMDSVQLLDELRQTAESQGATFHELTTVTDIETENGEVTTVVTDRGDVAVDEVLVAGNIWSPLIGEMVGVDVPLVPCQHQYAVFEPIDELADAEADVEQPWIRHQDSAMYFRQHRDAYGVGNYNHEPLLVDPTDIDSYADAIEDETVYDFVPGRGSNHEPFKQPSTKEFTAEHFEAARAETEKLFPALEGKELVKGFNGMFCFTPDHMPIMGESSEVDGFWISAAIWLTQAGGAGKVIAEMMEKGTPSVNVDAAHIDRFQPHSASPSFVWERGYESYDEVYDIHHPRSSSAVQRHLRESPFARYQDALDAEYYDLAGWERARYYEANRSLLDEYGDEIPDREGWEAENWSPIEGAEHLAVRDGVGLCDLTSFATIEISGSGAVGFAQRMFATDVDVPVGDVVYSPMLDESGGIIGDMTITRLDEETYFVSANSGGAGTKQLAWLREHAPDDGSVTVSDEISSRCGIGVWGPDARELLESVIHADLDDESFPYFSAKETYVGSVPVTALRVSYVGERGWELHAPTEYGANLWRTLWEAGEDLDVVAMGDGALNTMRLEKGYCMYGADIHSEYTPSEAGLGFTVDLDTDFVGRDALESANDDVDQHLTCLTLDDPDAIALDRTPILDGETTVGYVTSAEYGYSVGRCIAYGYLPTEYTDPGTSLEIQYENERYAATVRETPLFDPDGDRL
ncbi:FAD-dependent oxidoreductase [Haloarculaceae archaeon H-GB2-1]|nr:FAD-dependent oxidoreductase [Haloarculaceae archaeon H-GB1-1]MEA5406153.1 FAD-dependent oxidoreductase [Haloarculaceae archaeon H-GB2-1]